LVQEDARLEQDFMALPAGERSRLKGVLVADRGLARARVLRDTAVAGLAVLGVPLWLLDVFPARAWPQLRAFSVTLWAFAAVALVWALVLEWSWNRRRASEIAGLGPLPVLRTAAGQGGACAGTADEEH
jgi:hypothetical protein